MQISFAVILFLLGITTDVTIQTPVRGIIGQLARQNAKLKKATRYLMNYGYLGIDFDVEDTTEKKIEKKLKVFQRYAKVKPTGRLDAATIKRMSDPRCGMRDPLSKISSKLTFRRSKRYTLQGQKWDFTNNPNNLLTWKLVNTARQIPFETVRKIIHQALGKWSAVAMINFKEVTSDDADIIVKFVRLVHEDQYAFDGRGGTLAHAFYPYPGYKISGDMHFDNDEEFTYKKDYGTDLLWVATHEAGHSLGLEHSAEQNAVMYPWYQGGLGDFNLRHDDIVGIQTLYGARPKTTPAPKTEKPTEKPTTEAPPTEKPTTEAPTTEAPTTEAPTTEAPTTEAPTTEAPTTEAPTTEAPTTEAPTTEAPTTEAPTEPPTTQEPSPKPTKKPKKYAKDCPRGVSAAVIEPTTGWMFIFYDKYFYLVSRRGLKHGPIRVSSYFKRIQGTVSAAFVRKSDNHLILFAGNAYYEYYNFQLINGPRPVSDFGLPSSAKVDAAFYWKGNGRLYMFSGTQYYRLNRYSTGIDRYYPRTISQAWRGLPSRITMAVTSFKSSGQVGATYFVSNDKFYEFNDKKIRIQPGYPKHIKNWLLCNSDAEDPPSYPGVGALERYETPVDP